MNNLLINFFLKKKTDWNDRDLDPDLKEEHLWEEKWDDDDAEDDFSKQLK